MPNLKSFVHVSTAYVQAKNLIVEEKLFPAIDDWKTFIEFAENLDEDVLDALTLKLTDFAPNTYTFTKHLAEHVVNDYRNEFNLPITIVRPSVVTGKSF
jgi:alcohol-forming fatty acyl-CoA reductase